MISVDSYADSTLKEVCSQSNVQMIVAANQNIKSILQLNQISRDLSKRFLAIRMIASTGFIFNDLLEEYLVEDVDGESYSEV